MAFGDRAMKLFRGGRFPESPSLVMDGINSLKRFSCW